MTTPKHCTAAQLARYAFAPASPSEKAEVEQHLAACTECTEKLAAMDRFDATPYLPEAWEDSDEMIAGPPIHRSPGLAATATAIDEERAMAETALAGIMSISQFEHARIDQNPAFQTSEAVRVLNEHAHDLQKKEPRFALLIADAAVAIATKLAHAGRLRSMFHLGRAHFERGSTLVRIGKYKDAAQSLRQAERAYEQCTDAQWDLASVWLLQAVMLTETEQPAAAQPLAEAAARQFRRFKDVERELHAQLSLSHILYVRKKYEAAARTAESIAGRARTHQEPSLLAIALGNAGEAYLLLQEYSRAVPCFVEAHSIWEELGMEVDRVRMTWCLATVDVETGHLDAGIEGLERAYRAFEALGVVNDAAQARLQLGETLLLAGRPGSVPELLQNVVVTFASEDMMRNARIALAYLHEALAQRRATPELIRHVRRYIRDIPSHPNARFVPLQ